MTGYVIIVALLAIVVVIKEFYSSETTKRFIENEQKKTILEIQKIQESEVRKVVTPIQLQAYERLVLFLERMTPNNLVLRCYQPQMSTQLLKDVMIRNIRDEFEHNLSQQLYISQQAWAYIKNAKEDMINTINSVQAKEGENMTPTAFAGRLFELLAGRESRLNWHRIFERRNTEEVSVILCNSAAMRHRLRYKRLAVWSIGEIGNRKGDRNMTLEERINADIKAAMLAKDRKKLEALRAVKSAILLLKTDGSGSEISPEVEMACLQKLVKQRKESAELYKQQNRLDLYEEEAFQQSVIEKYLPEQMSEEEIESKLKEIISQTGACSIKDMGKVMGAAQKPLQEERTISLFQA